MRAAILAFTLLLAAAPALAGGPVDELAPLADYAGKTWRGRFTGPDGTEMVSKYLQNGEWMPGHTIVYVEAPEAEVKFE